MKKDDEIEDLFKKEFENFEPEVSSNVWKNIQIGLKGFGLGILVKVILNKIGTSTIIAIVSSVATVISTIMVMHWTNSDKTQSTENNKLVVPATTIEKPAQMAINEPGPVAVKAEQKLADKKTVVSSESNKTNEAIIAKTNKKEMESVIHKFSEKQVANIFATPVAGTIPLIVSLMNNGTGKVNKWTYGDSKVVETETSPVHIYNEPGVYTVKLTSIGADGKTTLDSVKIEVIGNSSVSSIPTDFSRTQLPMYLCEAKNVKNMNAIIFNKKGKAVYQSEDKWDGKWNGKNLIGEEAKEGTYFYIINAEGFDGKSFERKGSFNLTR